MSSYNVYIVEDHEMMREMTREFLAMLPDYDVAGIAETAEEALEHLPGMNLQLLLIDVSLPGMSGIDLLTEVRSRWPDLTCLMFSGHKEPSYVRRSLENGARGFVLKGDPDELTEAIDKVRQGQTYISDSLRRELRIGATENNQEPESRDAA